ncbi:MAG TPA: hypothetical protein GXZ47_02695 [Treponema sp.]|nr:hypothetical protein [Treponema sp.]
MYDFATIVPVVSLVSLPLLAGFVVVQTLLARRRLGSLTEAFFPRFHYQFVGVLIFSPLLIILAWYRNFSSLPLFALCSVGVIGFYIAARDVFISKLTGVYEYGVLWSNASVLFTSIDSLIKVDEHTLSFVLTNGSVKIFAAEDESSVSRLEAHVKTAMNTLQYQ